MAWHPPGKYVMDEAGLGRYLRSSSALRTCVGRRAWQGAMLARTYAPRDSGTYASQIGVRIGRDTSDFRICAWIIASAPHSVQVEFGRHVKRPYRGAGVLGRVVRELNVPQRRRAV